MSLPEISPFKKYDFNSWNLSNVLLARYGNYIPDSSESEKMVKIPLLFKNCLNLFFCSYPLLSFYHVNKGKVKKIELLLHLILFGVCIYNAVSDYFKFKKYEFWKDPEYCVKKTIELAKKIRKEKLSYNQLEELVGMESTAFVHLSVEDLAYLLSYQIKKCKTYREFRESNKNFPLKYCSENQLAKLKKLIGEDLQSFDFTIEEKALKFCSDPNFSWLLPDLKLLFKLDISRSFYFFNGFDLSFFLINEKYLYLYLILCDKKSGSYSRGYRFREYFFEGLRNDRLYLDKNWEEFKDRFGSIMTVLNLSCRDSPFSIYSNT